MSDEFSVTISAVVFPDGDYWVVQGIEHDICAQGRTIKDACRAFEEAVCASAMIGLAQGVSPLDDIAPAPEKYRRMFEHASMSMTATQLEPTCLPLSQQGETRPFVPVLRLFENSTENGNVSAYA
ncbi:MAG: hypothetical protein RIC04_02765 [Parvibaculum sp.]|uniref:hypothetical protein n=1 Tax=Parvibaculum sp. TaxID=2024848 RepID=UPI0032EB71A0